MPDDRLLHKRAGQSEKVSRLTDMEYRVWTTYLIGADDFGVMRFSAVALRAVCDALEHRPTKTLERAFETLVTVGLLRKFEHQNKTYVYQADWQDFQSVRYPRQSANPAPPNDLLANCTAAQQRLFALKRSNSTAAIPKDCGEVAEVSPTPARAGGRETANGKRLTAKQEGGVGETVDDGFAAFWQVYPKRKARDDAERAWRKLKPDAEQQAAILAAVEEQSRSPDWMKDGGKFIPYPASWLNGKRWLDEHMTAPQISERNVRSMGAIFGTN